MNTIRMSRAAALGVVLLGCEVQAPQSTPAQQQMEAGPPTQAISREWSHDTQREKGPEESDSRAAGRQYQRTNPGASRGVVSSHRRTRTFRPSPKGNIPRLHEVFAQTLSAASR